jgi:hypothetical protein
MRTTRRQFLRLVAGSAVACGTAPVWRHLPTSNAQSTAKELLALSWDGVERSVLWALLPRLKNLPRMGLNELVCVTAGLRGKTIQTTTVPQHAMAITGRNCSEWGTLSQTVWKPIPERYTIFEQLRTAWGSDAFLGGVEGKKQPGDSFWTTSCLASLDSIYPVDHHWDSSLGIRAVTDLVVATLRSSSGRQRFVYGHYKMPDLAGHRDGVYGAQYEDAILRLDVALGHIRSIFPELPVLIFSDHGFGQGGDPHKHNDSPNTFLATTWPIESRTYSMMEVYSVMTEALALAPPG